MFAIVIDVVTNEIKEGTLEKILYADDLVLIEETMVEAHNKCGICGRKTMENAVLCQSCRNWIHGRCAKADKILLQ